MSFYDEQNLNYDYGYAEGGNPNKADEPNYGPGWRKDEKKELKGYAKNDPSAAYRSILQRLGIPMSPYFKSFIHAAVTQGWSPAETKQRLYESKHFKKIFPGIFRPDGSMKMDPASYRKAEDDYKSAAREMGIRIGDIHTAKLIANDVSITEFQDRMTALDRMRDYGPFMQEFMNFAGGGSADFAGKKGMFDFVLGLSPKDFYQKYEQATMSTAAKKAGVDWISDKDIKMWTGFTEGQMSEQEYHDRMIRVAQKKVKEMPISQLHGFNVSKNDLVELEMGGPKAGEIARRIERGMKTEEAAWHRQDFSQTHEDFGDKGFSKREASH